MQKDKAEHLCSHIGETMSANGTVASKKQDYFKYEGGVKDVE